MHRKGAGADGRTVGRRNTLLAVGTTATATTASTTLGGNRVNKSTRRKISARNTDGHTAKLAGAVARDGTRLVDGN